MFIAAVALVQQLVVVTRDVSEFVEASVPVLDPETGAFTSPGGHKRALQTLDRADLLDDFPL